MIRYLIRRLGWAAALVLVVTFAAYAIFTLIPADPAAQFAGRGATDADIERASRYLGLDEPVYVQYGRFLWRLVGHGSLGTSFATRQDVNDIVAAAAPVTLSVMAGGMLLMLAISVPIGLVSGLRPRSPFDRLSSLYVFVGASLPHVWIGLLLAYFVGFRLGWTPISGYCDVINPATECGGVREWASHLILPWLTIGGLGGALYARMIRSSVISISDEDYVRTARAKGAGETRIVLSHVLRNALLPIVTMLGIDIGFAFGGAAYTEAVFALPGLGKQSIDAVANLDFPVLQGILVFTTTAIIVANLIADLLYMWIDPRIAPE